MIQLAALFLAAATSQTADTIFSAGLDAPYVCPASITTGNDTRTYRSTSDIIYLPVTSPRRNVDIREWDNIWGHIDYLDGLTLWPGVRGSSPTIKTIGKHEYMGAKFHVPEDVGLMSGGFAQPSYGGGPTIDFSVSRFCGDFNPADDACLVTNTADDNTFMYWKTSPGNRFFCHLEPGTDYYVNVKFHNPQTTGPDCAGTACQSTIQSWN